MVCAVTAKQILGEDPHARTDFEDGRALEGTDDVLGYGLVGQEMLAEGFFSAYFHRRKDNSNSSIKVGH